MTMTAGERWGWIEALLATERPLGVVCTGGGSQLIAWLHNHPGASRSMIEATIPYHPKALARYLGAPGPHRVRASTAVEMACIAFRRLRDLLGDGVPTVGFGCTAALTTRRRRRGADRVALATRTAHDAAVFEVAFDKDVWEREQQEDLLSEVGMVALLQACGVPSWQPKWPAGARIECRRLRLDDPLSLLYAEDLTAVEVDTDGSMDAVTARSARLLLPGSFNPLHSGHEGLMAAAERVSNRSGAYELSVENVDKPVLPRPELERRLRQFRGKRPVVVTRAATFSAKVRLFADCYFAIGYDTAVRLLMPAYYGGLEEMERAFQAMRAAGCRYAVAGRLHAGRYRSLEDLDPPVAYQDLFQPVPETAFRCDLSSSELRAREQA